MYANVDNKLELATSSGISHVAVAVPTGLFTLMKDVFRVPVDVTVNLAIDEIVDERGDRDSTFVFSIIWGNEIRDLWAYSRGSLPAWLTAREYRL